MQIPAFIAGAVLLTAAAAPGARAECGQEPITFTADSGESVAAWRGRLEVPELWGAPDSRTIELGYVCFRATGEEPGAPIVYLAGGPGGSGIDTARGPRFALFMAMREHGDVIAFDQRGTGQSDHTAQCRSSVRLREDEPHSDADIAEAYRAAVRECAGFWQGEGIDIRGYTTAQSVADLDALRVHLGAEKISLWGISYGSHLAFAALDAIDERIERVIVASAEGLDQTVKLPARTDAYFARLQAAVDAQPGARAAYPDIAAMMTRVHARLETEPVLLQLPQEDGSSAPFLLQRSTMQRMTSALINDPQNARVLLMVYASLDAGDTGLVTSLLARFVEPGEPIELRAMPTAMDLASGISPGRLALVEAQAEASLVGLWLNFPMPQIAGTLPGLDLGEDFRDGPVSDVPVLLLTGTLDGRTYPEGQAEAVAGLTEVTQVTIVNAGHNLFMSSPEVGAVMAAFMRGEPVHTRQIVVEPVDFAP